MLGLGLIPPCQRSGSASVLPMLQHLHKHVALQRFLVLDDELGVRAFEHGRASRARVLHRAARLLRQPEQLCRVLPTRTQTPR